MTHPFKVGDKIVMTDKNLSSGYGTPPKELIGETGVVTAIQEGVFSFGNYTDWLGIRWDNLPERNGEEAGGSWIAERFEKVPAFKPGDKVRYIATHEEHTVRPGDTAVVGPKGIFNSTIVKRTLLDVVWGIDNSRVISQQNGGYPVEDFEKVTDTTRVCELIDTAVRSVLEGQITLDTVANDVIESVLQTLNVNYNLKD